MDSQKQVTDKGGTMRLGAYACDVLMEHAGKPTRAFEAYGQKKITERHRHRFEVSNSFRPQLEAAGLIVSGRYHDKDSGTNLVEMIELSGHPWFLGCQFHPEFLSKPLAPHPLFQGFIQAAKEAQKGEQRALPGVTQWQKAEKVAKTSSRGKSASR